MIDLSTTGIYENNADGEPLNYCRVTMIDHYTKMRVFRGEHWEALSENRVGLPDYGSSVEFTIDNDMFPGYVPGQKYYARYKWIDSNYAGDDWIGFSFSGDVADIRPIRLPDTDTLSIKNYENLEGALTFDYLDGDVQNFELSGDATLDLSDIANVNFGSALILNCHTGNNTLTVTNGQERELICSGDKVYIVVITNFGSLQIAVTETI